MHLAPFREPSREDPPGGFVAWPPGTLLKSLLPKACESSSPLQGREWVLRKSLQTGAPGPRRLVQLWWEDGGTQQGERGRCASPHPSGLLPGDSRGWVQSVSTAPEGRGETSHLKKQLTWCDLDSGSQDSSPSHPASPPWGYCLPTLPDMGQVTGGCFPRGQSRSAFSLPDSPDHLNHLRPLLQILIAGPTQTC